MFCMLFIFVVILLILFLGGDLALEVLLHDLLVHQDLARAWAVAPERCPCRRSSEWSSPSS